MSDPIAAEYYVIDGEDLYFTVYDDAREEANGLVREFGKPITIKSMNANDEVIEVEIVSDYY